MLKCEEEDTAISSSNTNLRKLTCNDFELTSPRTGGIHISWDRNTLASRRIQELVFTFSREEVADCSFVAKVSLGQLATTSITPLVNYTLTAKEKHNEDSIVQLALFRTMFPGNFNLFERKQKL